MGASSGSHDTNVDYPMGVYAISTHREYATEESIVGSEIRFFDSIANPCPRLRFSESQYVRFAFRNAPIRGDSAYHILQSIVDKFS